MGCCGSKNATIEDIKTDRRNKEDIKLRSTMDSKKKEEPKP